MRLCWECFIILSFFILQCSEHFFLKDNVWLACSTYKYVGLLAELSDEAISRLDTLSGAQESLV